MCACNAGLVANAAKTACVSSSESAKNGGCPLCDSRFVLRGNPINAGTGNKAQIETDFSAPNGLEFRRVYNSLVSYDSVARSPFGKSQWDFNWNRSIQVGDAPPPSYPLPQSPLYGSLPNHVYRVGMSVQSLGVAVAAFLSRGDGSVITFTKTSGNPWQATADINGQLENTTDGMGQITGWTYTTGDRQVEQYDGAGKLLSVTDRHGQVTRLIYSDGTDGATTGKGDVLLNPNGLASSTVVPRGYLIRVEDPYGRHIRIQYLGGAYQLPSIKRVTDLAGGVYEYTFDTSGNLASVTYPGSPVPSRQYKYNEQAYTGGANLPHALTGIIDENGARYATYKYDAQGRAISTEHGSGAGKVSLSYNANGTTTVTDALNSTYTDHFERVFDVLATVGTDQPAGSGTPVASNSKTYDANGNISSLTDFNGNKTCYAYDMARNLETVRLEGLPSATACPADLAAYVPSTAPGSVERKITTQWHATQRLPAVVAEPLRKTTYSYNGDGSVTCGFKADGVTPVPGVLCSKTLQPTLDTTGAQGLGAAAAGALRVARYTYNAYGRILTEDGPRTDVADITTYTYYPADVACTGAPLGCRGQLETVTNALGHVTTLSNYDAHGRPQTITGPNGLVTSLAYDPRGRLTGRSAGSETTAYTYDGAGQLKTVTLPGRTSPDYTYTYDDAHRLTGITDAAGNTIHYTLDAMGNRTTEQIKDAAGAIIQTHSRQFDALNRLWKDIGAVNQTTTYAYDANGNVTAVTDPLNRQSTNSYDALNRLITSTDAATPAGITHYGYDGQDQLISVTDPRNLTTGYTRDGLGNLQQLSSPDTGTTSNTYDEAGNLKTRTDAKGQIAAYTYDPLNRVTAIVYTDPSDPARNQTVSYQYDQGTNCANCLGHLAKITDGTGTIEYSYDPQGRLTGEIKTVAGTAYTTGYRYDARGLLDRITYPSGRTVDYSFDGMGRIAGISTTLNGATAAIASNITHEPFGGVHSFTYGDGQTPPVQTYTRNRDGDGRIGSYTLNGTAMSIGYDPASQIISIGDLTNPAATYAYDPLGRLTVYSQGSENQTFGYDATGNRTGKTAGSTLTGYGIDPASNRLTGISVNGGTAQAVSHDPIGATTADPGRQYTYDVRGRLIQSITAQGTVTYAINALGLRVRKQAPYAGADTLYHYDAQGRLISESATSSTFTREYIYLGDMPVAVMK